MLEDALLADDTIEWEGLDVVELGAGSGWLAMRLASLGAWVTATDRKGMLGLLTRNVLLNQRRYLTSPAAEDLAEGLQVEVADIDWDDFASQGGDPAWTRASDALVIGSDLVCASSHSSNSRGSPRTLANAHHLHARASSCVAAQICTRCTHHSWQPLRASGHAVHGACSAGRSATRRRRPI